MRTLQSRKSGHDSTSLKLYFLRERLKRIWTRSSTRSFLRKSRWTRFYLAFGGGGRRCNPNIRAPLGLIVGTERRLAGQWHTGATPSQIGPSQVPAGQGNTKRNIIRTSNFATNVNVGSGARSDADLLSRALNMSNPPEVGRNSPVQVAIFMDRATRSTSMPSGCVYSSIFALK
jgi:hypothetical protein